MTHHFFRPHLARVMGFALVLYLTGCTLEEGLLHQPTPRGLTPDDSGLLKGLLQNQSDESFDQRLKEISKSGERASVVILTHAMFRLPWVKELEPRLRGDLRMRKLRVEKTLDHPVAYSLHDTLSAYYFRALDDGKGAIDSAETDLLNWTLGCLPQMSWDSEFKVFRLSRDQPQE